MLEESIPLPRQVLLSLIVPVYNEQHGLEAFFSRVLPILEAVTPDWEIICINDGSRDQSLQLLAEFHVKDPRIKIISLSRNFGKEAALSAGLHLAAGEAVIPLDADLQDPPELIPELIAKWQEGYRVVLATRRSRESDTWFKRRSAQLFYRLLGHTSEVPIPPDTGDFRLMDAQVVQVLRYLPERSRFMKGLFAWVGFTSTTVYYDRPARHEGQAKQNLLKLWRLAKDGIFSFTTMPLQLATYCGAFISLCAFSYALFLILRTLIQGVDLPGYASIMVTMLFLGGLQLIGLGIIGEYLGRIYRETKQRPLYIVDRFIGFD